jgi:phosphatidylglycerol:prolipoprotein diacylglycerol transferase
VIVHSAFDLLAVVTAAVVFYLLPLPQSSIEQPWRLHPVYVGFASLGMITGALFAGTGNLLLSGFNEIGKSVVGGLAGAILAIEILKRRFGIVGSTGLRFAAPLAAAIAVGRLGCFFAGIEDRTYGTPTDLPWGRDFGDGVPRHPVQLYEAIAMTLFLAAFMPMLHRGYRIATIAGFLPVCRRLRRAAVSLVSAPLNRRGPVRALGADGGPTAGRRGSRWRFR